MRAVLAIAAAALLLGGARPGQDAGFGWLAGDWREDAGARWTTEHWEAAPGGMKGVGSSGSKGATAESEAMTITLDGGVAVFTALPNDAQAPTPFREVAHGPQDVTFENAGHDYPQRIRYWREGEALLAEISLADGSKPMRWRYTRVK
jgi:Domain of unknown function (DUF6265)